MSGRRLRVAFFEPYPHAYGGAARTTHWLAQALPGAGVDVRVVVPGEGPFSERLRADGIPVEVVTAPEALDHFGQDFAPRRLARSALALPGFARRLARAFAAVHVVHANDTRGILLAGPAARLARRPVVWQLHSVSPWPWANRIGRTLASETVGVSASAAGATSGIVVGTFEAPPLPPEAGTIELAEPGPEPLVATAGRIYVDKGFDQLVRALPLVRKAVPRTRLRIIGPPVPGHERAVEELRSLAAELGVDDAVELTGWVDRPDQAWRDAWVYAQPSRSETWCYTAIEAMLSGLPIVATDVPGLREHVIDGRTGRLVPFGDPGILADALVELLSDRQRAAELAASGQRHVHSYASVEDYAARWARRYRALETGAP